MTKQVIQLGTPPTGVGGDTPRSANVKINTNFDELYAADAVNYKKTNVVGYVGHVSGAPTGAVIETSTNASGTYTKFADGTMICHRSLIYSNIPITTATGSLYYAAGGLPGVGFAANFNTPPDVVINVKPSAGVVWHTVLGSPTVSSGPSLFLVAPNSLTVDIVVTQIATGRWF